MLEQGELPDGTAAAQQLQQFLQQLAAAPSSSSSTKSAVASSRRHDSKDSMQNVMRDAATSIEVLMKVGIDGNHCNNHQQQMQQQLP